MRRKKEEFSLKKKDITIEVHGETLNGLASVCPRVSFERAFGNVVLLDSLSFSFKRIRHSEQAKLSLIKFVPKSPIYRPLMAIHKSNEKM